MTGYTKLFGSIVASTIWREPHQTRIVWITMLALANKVGIVEASIPGLADLSRVTIPECEAALLVLKSPDAYSRTKEFEGRRIEECDGGWMVLNHPKYRAKMSADERREYLRIKQQEHRDRVSKAQNNPAPSVDKKEGVFEGLKKEISEFYERKDAWSHYEESTLYELTRSQSSPETDWKELVAYHASLPTKDRKFFPRSIESLLTGWKKTLDAAKTTVKLNGSTERKRTPAEESALASKKLAENQLLNKTHEP